MSLYRRNTYFKTENYFIVFIQHNFPEDIAMKVNFSTLSLKKGNDKSKKIHGVKKIPNRIPKRVKSFIRIFK